MTYYGTWEAGNTYCAIPYESTNKNQLIKLMTKMTYGNCHSCATICYWEVWYIDEEGNKQRVAHGGKGYGGRKWREDFK